VSRCDDVEFPSLLCPAGQMANGIFLMGTLFGDAIMQNTY
jgi:hypothetical protein